MYLFRPLGEEHLEQLFRWLQNPHVRAWWDSEDNWDEFRARYIRTIESEKVFPHIVYCDEMPIGYINYWFVKEDANFKPLFPSNTVGTDQFIGPPELIGKGIGSEFVRQFTDDLLLNPEIELVITDPDPRNLAAIRAYEKAGFMKSKQMMTSAGEVQLLEKRMSVEPKQY